MDNLQKLNKKQNLICIRKQIFNNEIATLKFTCSFYTNRCAVHFSSDSTIDAHKFTK